MKLFKKELETYLENNDRKKILEIVKNIKYLDFYNIFLEEITSENYSVYKDFFNNENIDILENIIFKIFEYSKNNNINIEDYFYNYTNTHLETILDYIINRTNNFYDLNKILINFKEFDNKELCNSIFIKTFNLIQESFIFENNKKQEDFTNLLYSFNKYNLLDIETINYGFKQLLYNDVNMEKEIKLFIKLLCPNLNENYKIKENADFLKNHYDLYYNLPYLKENLLKSILEKIKDISHNFEFEKKQRHILEIFLLPIICKNHTNEEMDKEFIFNLKTIIKELKIDLNSEKQYSFSTIRNEEPITIKDFLENHSKEFSILSTLNTEDIKLKKGIKK